MHCRCGQQGTGRAGIIVERGRVVWWVGGHCGQETKGMGTVMGRVNWDMGIQMTQVLSQAEEHGMNIVMDGGFRGWSPWEPWGQQGLGCRAQVPLCFWRSSVVCSSTS